MNTQTFETTRAALCTANFDYLDAIDQTPKRCNIKSIVLYLGVENEYKKLNLVMQQGKVPTHDEIDSFKTRVASAVKFLKTL